MTHRVFAVVAALGLATIPAPHCFARPDEPAQPAQTGAAAVALRPQALREALLEALKAPAVPGIAAAVFTDEGIVASEAAGTRVRGQEAAVEITDPFHLGSCTKAMTATLAAALVDEGVIRWDSTLGEVFPDIAPSMQGSYAGVTLEQLLTHRAGVPAFTSGAAPESVKLRSLDNSLEDQTAAFVRLVTSDPPVHEPGSSFLYSNGGYGLAAAMMERAAKAPWRMLMRERLFAPLAMTTAGFGWPATDEQPDRPRGHWGAPDAPSPMALNAQYRLQAALAPAGDVHASIDDWARFGILHLRGMRTGASPRGLTISAQSFTKLHTPLGERSYAMGWAAGERDGVAFQTHSGSAGTFYATVTLIPEWNLGVVIAVNSGTPRVTDAVRAVEQRLIEAYGPEAADDQ
ncbi:MAG: serine hydrolase domain-containing protein [Planctomycetota bacterium]|nr:serine hydrolase domain-containing protein [Planctomycetota bacterium]